MAVEMMRLILKPEGADEATAAAKQIWVDLSVDSETAVSTGPFPAWGRVGDWQQPDTLIPFTLMMDGRLDTGVYASDEDRKDVLEIRKATLEVGGTIVRRAGDSATNYTIESMKPLIAN